MQNRFVKFEKLGGPEVLQIEIEPVPKPGPTEVVVKNLAIGFNYLDTLFRTGFIPVRLPSRVGTEAAGIVESIGADVPQSAGLEVGTRVAYFGRGTDSDYTPVAYGYVAKLPAGVSYEVAAASLSRGLTVQYLLDIYKPEKDEIILAHAGAGGVGLIFSQWAASLGARVITTVSTDAKAELAKQYGAWQVLKYTDDIPARVAELTDGKKVKVVYDSVGKSTWEQSLDSLAKRGLLIAYGSASGKVDPVDITTLNRKGSLFLTWPGLYDYVTTPEEFQQRASEFLLKVESGAVKIHIGQKFKLSEVQVAHKLIGERKTSGSTILIP